MLDELSKKDKHWRKVALRICGDRMLADDIVQEMYLYFHNKSYKVNDYYVSLKIYGLFIDYVRTKNKRADVSLTDFYYIKDKNEAFEPDDYEMEILTSFSKLDWIEKELITEHHINGKSLRQIQRDYPLINYGYAYRVIKQAKDKLR